MHRGIVIIFLILTGCAHSWTTLSIRDALDAADAKSGKKVRVAGYYFHHFEGDSLEYRPGEPDFGICLAEKRSSGVAANIPMRHGTEFHQKYVVISGILRRGRIGMTDRTPFLEIESVEEVKR